MNQLQLFRVTQASFLTQAANLFLGKQSLPVVPQFFLTEVLNMKLNSQKQ